MSDLIRLSSATRVIASQFAFEAEMETTEEFSWEDFKVHAETLLARCEVIDPIKILEEQRKVLAAMDMAGAEHVLLKHAIEPLMEILEEEDGEA